MSEQTVKTFLSQLSNDPTLREQLSATLADAEDSTTGETVIAFATEAGFDISAEDLEWLNNALSDDALSDEALDEVSGGWLGATAYALQKIEPQLDYGKNKNALNPFKKDFWTPLG